MKIPSPFGEEKSIKKKYAKNNIRAHRRNRISHLPPPPQSSHLPIPTTIWTMSGSVVLNMMIIVVAFIIDLVLIEF